MSAMTTGVANRLAVMAGDIKLAHSVFALPFALLATFLAAAGRPEWTPLGLIVLCMVLARSFAMLANRYVDRDIDADNPRTANRALPSGRLSPGEVRLALAGTGGGLIGAAALFGVLNDNWWPLIFSPLVLGWLGIYGLTKRWTLLCHFFLGAALALSPLAAGLAIKPTYLGEPTLWWLAGFVLLWVGGFDIIYALQDMEVDRRDGLHSIPAALGRTRGLAVAKAAHVGALAMLLAAQKSTPMLGGLFFIGVALVGGMLIVEHRAASRGAFSMAFFTANGLISLLLGGLGIAETVIAG
jgi:4-hydroxybenzoate polyprenyltransferase